MIRPRKPETQERRTFLKEMRKEINSIYKFLQKHPKSVLAIDLFKNDLRKVIKEWLNP